MKQELLKGLTKEQIATAKACNSTEELLALAKKEGYQLSDEQLEAVSGGGICSSQHGPLTKECPACGTPTEGKYLYNKSCVGEVFEFACPFCGNKWKGSKRSNNV